MTAEQKKRSLVIFRHLTPFNVHLALLLRLIGWGVVYIEAQGFLRSEKWKLRLSRCGIEWADCARYKGLDFGQNLRTNAAYTKRVMDRAFADDDFCVLTGRDAALTGRERSFRALAFNRIAADIAPYAYAYGLAEYFREAGIEADVYQRLGLKNACFDASGLTAVRNLYKINPLYLIQKTIRNLIVHPVVSRMICAVLPNDRSDGATSGAPADDGARGKVLYFPHLGVSYLHLYAKDQFYSTDSASPLHPKNVLHVEFGWMVPKSEWANVNLSYGNHGLSPLVLEAGPRPGALAYIRSYAEFARDLRGKDRAIKIFAFASCYQQYLEYRRILAPLCQADLALVGYDMHFPVAASIVLQSWGIKVVATQERFIQPFHGNFALSFHTYFVHGRYSKNQIESNPNMDIQNAAVIGDVRVDDIVSAREQARERRANQYKEFDRICLVLDYYTRPDHQENSYYFWLGPAANLLFYGHIEHLARTHPDCAFIIRGKETNWMNEPDMQAAKSGFERLGNVFIDQSTSEYGVAHQLAAMSDVVVARHTSLCDQCLSAGIPVLMDETLPNGGRLISAMHDYAGYPVMVYGQDELTRRFEDCLRTSQLMPPERLAEMQRVYYGHDAADSASPRERLAAALKALLPERADTAVASVPAQDARPAAPVGGKTLAAHGGNT